MREFNLTSNGVLGDTSIQQDMMSDSLMNIACDVIFTQMHTKPELKKYAQMPAKKGIKVFGQAAVAAMIKEFSQLNQGAVPNKPVVAPVDVNTITPQEKKKALPAVNLTKEKRT